MVGAMDKRLPSAAIACLLGLPLLGCDDDDERRPPPYVSGVESEAPVSQLDDSDKREICQSYSGYVDAYVDFEQLAYAVCLPTSIFAARNAEDCEAYLHDCVETFPQPVTIRASLNDQQRCFENLDRCDLTVGDLGGCVNVNLGFVINILENFSCRAADDAEQRRAADDLMQTANVCGAANAACRDFADVTVY
jgi:hypothetical protein